MNLKELARSKGTNLKQVAEKCGIPPTTLYAISRGDTNFDNIGIGTAMKVAAALEMSVEELYTGVPQQKSVSLPAMSTEETELLNLYRNMDNKHQTLLLESARSFAALSVKDGAGIAEDVERAGCSVM